MFFYHPKKYSLFVAAILDNEAVAGLFPEKDQRTLFDLVIKQPTLSYGVVSSLKQRYLTAEEKTAERDAEEAANQKAEQQKRLDME